MTGKNKYEWMSSEYEYILICECTEKEIFQIKKDGKSFDVMIHHKKRRAMCLSMS